MAVVAIVTPATLGTRVGVGAVDGTATISRVSIPTGPIAAARVGRGHARIISLRPSGASVGLAGGLASGRRAATGSTRMARVSAAFRGA